MTATLTHSRPDSLAWVSTTQSDGGDPPAQQPALASSAEQMVGTCLAGRTFPGSVNPKAAFETGGQQVIIA